MGSEDSSQRAADSLKKLDKDGDGTLQLGEIVAAFGDRESPAELEKKLLEFDRDGDKQLGPAELAEALRTLSKR
jgi:Ca2+-binding EF-hand superfamily protein